ncbi:MAG: ribosome silencing factor [Gemmatimonadales bacterium]|jgi:ribosome-associated protein
MTEPRSDAAPTGQLRWADLPPHVQRALELCQDRHARDPLVLDLRGLSDATDFFLIASGDSDVHVRAISENITRGLSEAGVKPAGVEGERAARWVLLDYIDFVVHVFHPAIREFYRLESLWGDAPLLLMIDEPPP